jgi:hypothetical protein
VGASRTGGFRLVRSRLGKFISGATPTENVGIGMDNSEAKLQVAGDTLLLADIKVDGPTSTYFVSKKRYHMETTKAFEGTTVPLDMTIANNLCKDGKTAAPSSEA